MKKIFLLLIITSFYNANILLAVPLTSLKNQHNILAGEYEDLFFQELLPLIETDFKFDEDNVVVVPYMTIIDTLLFTKSQNLKDRYYSSLGLDNTKRFIIYFKNDTHIFKFCIFDGKISTVGKDVFSEKVSYLFNKDKQFVDMSFLLNYTFPSIFEIIENDIISSHDLLKLSLFDFYGSNLYHSKNPDNEIDLTNLQVQYAHVNQSFKIHLLNALLDSNSHFELTDNHQLLIIPYLMIKDSTIFQETYFNNQLDENIFYKSIAIDTNHRYNASLSFNGEFYFISVYEGIIRSIEKSDKLHYSELLNSGVKYPIFANSLMYCNLLFFPMRIEKGGIFSTNFYMSNLFNEVSRTKVEKKE